MKYATQSRVTVPGTKAQGVIVDATETVSGFPIYTLRWLDEAGETHTGSCGEGDLAEANAVSNTIGDNYGTGGAAFHTHLIGHFGPKPTPKKKTTPKRKR